MADNLALKLLVAGIIGAVVGAAAAEKYHFPTGLVYGGFNSRPAPYGMRSIDPMTGSGDAGEERERVVVVPDWPTELPTSRPPRYRAPPRNPPEQTSWCWQEYENWNFAMTGRWVPCQPGRRSRGG
jgi:hypothetical protein